MKIRWALIFGLLNLSYAIFVLHIRTIWMSWFLCFLGGMLLAIASMAQEYRRWGDVAQAIFFLLILLGEFLYVIR